ncbi:MAG: transcriptional repressor [Treponema sp.]|nr:transcriptional repressor [Treponema sp.]
MPENKTSISDIEQSLHRQGFRMTEQKKKILKSIFLDGNTDCKEICYLLKAQSSGVSTATVYRTVRQLEELGFINRQGFCVNTKTHR